LHFVDRILETPWISGYALPAREPATAYVDGMAVAEGRIDDAHVGVTRHRFDNLYFKRTTTMRSRLIFGMATILCASLSACGGVDQGEQGPTSGVAESPAGLTFSLNSDDHASGDFLKDGVDISFDVRKKAEEVMLEIRAADGRELLSIRQTPAMMTASVLGGQMTVASPTQLLQPVQSLAESEVMRLKAQVVINGDEAALAQLTRLPEFRILGDLGQALDQAGLAKGVSSLLQFRQLQAVRVCDDCPDQPPPGGDSPPDSSCGLFKEIVCGAALATCAVGCAPFGAGPAYVACVIPCLTAMGAIACKDCL